MWLGGNKNRVTSTDENACRTLREQRVVVSVPQIWKKWVRRFSVFSKYVDAQHCSKYSYSRFWSRVSKCRESYTLKSVCSNTVEYEVSNSSEEEFKRLRKHAKIA